MSRGVAYAGTPPPPPLPPVIHPKINMSLKRLSKQREEKRSGRIPFPIYIYIDLRKKKKKKMTRPGFYSNAPFEGMYVVKIKKYTLDPS